MRARKREGGNVTQYEIFLLRVLPARNGEVVIANCKMRHGNALRWPGQGDGGRGQRLSPGKICEVWRWCQSAQDEKVLSKIVAASMWCLVTSHFNDFAR